MSKYKRILYIGFATGLEYRADFMLSIMSRLYPVIIQLFMWSYIFAASADPVVMNYTYKQMLIYIILTCFLSQFTETGFEYEVGNSIKSGALSKYLVQPLSFFWTTFYKFLGNKLSQLVVISVGTIITMFTMYTIAGLRFEPARVLCFLFAVCLSIILAFIIGFCTSMLAFWITECGGIFHIVSIATSIISGGVMPLDVFGIRILQVLRCLPFYYMTYFLNNILNGKEQMDSILFGMAVQMIWIVALYFLSHLLWKKGLKRYIAVGG